MPGPPKGKGGRPPIPNEAKKRRGTARADRLPKTDLVAVPPIDSPALELTVEQALERSLAAGAAWLAESDTLAIAVLREALEHYAELKADPKAKPSDVLAALKAVSVEAGTLGFNPAERARLGLAEVKARSHLEDLRAKQAKVGDEGSAGGQKAG